MLAKTVVSGRIRGPYGRACDICSRRRAKCDGDPGTVCPRCRNAGRGEMCSWNGYYTRQKRGDLFVVDTRRHTNSEACRQLLLEYHNYVNVLEAELENHIRTLSLDGTDFRADRPKDPDDLMGLTITLSDLQSDDTQETESVEFDETESPTNIHLWPDKLALVHYGPCSPFRFRSDPLPVPSRFPAISENPDATYVLQVVGDGRGCSPHFDWSRYLPSAVQLDRRSHDKALDRFFKFCTPFGLRLIPDLFLKDMNQALIGPRPQQPPQTSHYSPMLHNILIASALGFLDDPHFQDLEVRRHFIDAAKDFMEAECRKPSIAVVQALSLLGNFYGSQGEQGLGFISFGQSVRVAQALGLHLDCSDSELVKRSLMDKSDQIDRNWVTWSTFIIDVCWSLYVGREFTIAVPPDNFPLPYIDSALDEMRVAYGNLPPQPNHLTKTFHANAELFIIGRDILEVNNALSKAKARSSIIFDRIGDIGVKLQTWYTSLPPELQVAKSRSTVLAPHKLTLHLCYWWLVVLLHRPFFHHGASIKGGRQIDHVKVCKRSSDRIMEILKTWQEFFGLRFCPVTIIQIAFAAGSVYLLLAMRACSGMRIAKKELNHALEQQHLVATYLQEIGRSWPGANKVSEILKDLVQQRLKPRLDAIPVRKSKSGSHEGNDCSMNVELPSCVPGQGIRRRSSSSKARPVIRLPRRDSRSRASAKESPGSRDISCSSQPAAMTTAPMTISLNACEAEPSDFNADYHRSNTTHLGFSNEGTSDAHIYDNISFDRIFHQPFPSPPGRLSSQDISAGPHPQQSHNGLTAGSASSFWPSLHPNTILGVPEGQPIPESSFWHQIGEEDAAQANPAFMRLLDEYLQASGDSSLAAPQSEPNYVAGLEDMDVSADERNYWVGKLG